MKHLVFAGLFLMATLTVAQVEEVNPPSYIQTVTFKGGTPQAQLPIVELGSPIILEFDDLNASESDYFYTITHYNFDWTPSDLAKSEYLNGFDDVNINNWENSYNTLQSFTHYTLRIPNRDTRGIRKTGNYLLTILDRYGDVVLSRKFIVYSNESTVG